MTLEAKRDPSWSWGQEEEKNKPTREYSTPSFYKSKVEKEPLWL
jgi:hypothetical protein